MEVLARVDTLCLDKTGTITTGRIRLERVEGPGGTGAGPELRGALAALTSQESNATALAVREGLGELGAPQHLLNGQTIFRINYIREFGKKATLYVDPGISLMNYRLQNERMKYVWTFRTNTWVRYRFNSLHWIGVGFSHHNNQPEISTLNEVDQTIDFYQIKRGNPNLKNTKLLNLYMMYEGRIGPFNMQARVWKEQFKHNIYPHYYTEGNKLISSYRSDGSFNRFNADMSVSCRISDHIRTRLGLEYHDMYTDIE